MKIKIRHMVGFFVAFLILIFSLFYLYPNESRWFKPALGMVFFVAVFQFWIDVINENKKHNELEVKFLEFVRGVSDGVKAGIPIPKAIAELKKTDYGALTPYVSKLIHQIEWGVPLRDAFMRFALDTGNPLIKRSMIIVVEAERSGGHIDQVLEAVTSSVLSIKKIKEERRSNIYTQVIQGYFIFVMFVAIMIILQVFLLPELNAIGGTALTGISAPGLLAGGGTTGADGQTTAFPSTVNFNLIFTFLLLFQG